MKRLKRIWRGLWRGLKVFYPIPRPLPQKGKGSKPLPFWGEVWRGSSPLDAD